QADTSICRHLADNLTTRSQWPVEIEEPGRRFVKASNRSGRTSATKEVADLAPEILVPKGMRVPAQTMDQEPSGASAETISSAASTPRCAGRRWPWGIRARASAARPSPAAC